VRMYGKCKDKNIIYIEQAKNISKSLRFSDTLVNGKFSSQISWYLEERGGLAFIEPFLVD
jgi:hypothetical protein